MLLPFSNDLLHSLLKVVLKLCLGFNFPFKLCSRSLILLLDGINHFLELVDNSFIPHDFLLLSIYYYHARESLLLYIIILHG